MSFCHHQNSAHSCILCAIENQTKEIIKAIKAKHPEANKKTRTQKVVLKAGFSFEQVESLIKYFTAIGFSTSVKQHGKRWTIASIKIEDDNTEYAVIAASLGTTKEQVAEDFKKINYGNKNCF